MRRMWAEQAVPRLAHRLGDQFYVSKTLKTIGIGESAAERAIADVIHRGYPVVATYAKDDGVHIRIVAGSPDRDAAEAAVRHTEVEIRTILDTYVYGEDPITLGVRHSRPDRRDRATRLRSVNLVRVDESRHSLPKSLPPWSTLAAVLRAPSVTPPRSTVWTSTSPTRL